MIEPGPTAGLPRVPITVFKVNPSAYLVSGALVTNHGNPRAAFLPIGGATSAGESLADVKAQLLMLNRMREPSDAAQELGELTATRDAETIGRAR